MEKRPLKELFELVLVCGNNEFKSGGWWGFCAFVRYLYMQRKYINGYEYDTVRRFINSHRPKKGSPHYRESMRKDMFYWKPRTWTPRKRWLEDQIKSL